MDMVALLQNLKRAKALTGRWSDAVAYLRWVYGRGERSVTIKFNLLPPCGDLKLSVRNNRGADAFIFSEVFIHRYYDVLLPFVPHTILDLGANAGLSTVFFGKRYPKAQIACVEPIPDNVELLRSNLSENQLVATIFEAAVAVADGVISMELSSKDYGHKVYNIPFGADVGGELIEVRAVSVPTIMAELGWDRISLLKMDIEGYEGVLLREGAEWLWSVDALVVECHEGFSSNDLEQVALKFGFGIPRAQPGVSVVLRSLG